MRHRVAHRKLGRVSEHRIALLRNQAEALLRHERIRTTVPKAKELRPFVERLITVAKRGVADGSEARVLHARRLVLRDIPDVRVVGKLFDTIAPRFAERPGGYTRILRLGHRKGDGADVAQIELVGSEYQPGEADADESAEASMAPTSRGVGGRLKAAADRLRGKGDETDETSADAADSPGSGRRAKASKRKAGS